MIGLLKRAIAHYARTTGRGTSLYKKFCKPDGYEWAQHFGRWGGLHAVGKGAWINLGCNITDPAMLKLGDNVGLSDCTIFGHDGIVHVINARDGTKLDSVGGVNIRANSFVGHGAIVMPRVTIGPNSVVAAGAVVLRDVPPGMVVGGNPARVICTMETLVKNIQERCAAYPWMDLIENRDGLFDPELEPKLQAMRAEYFFGEHANG